MESELGSKTNLDPIKQEISDEKLMEDQDILNNSLIVKYRSSPTNETDLDLPEKALEMGEGEKGKYK